MRWLPMLPVSSVPPLRLVCSGVCWFKVGPRLILLERIPWNVHLKRDGEKDAFQVSGKENMIKALHGQELPDVVPRWELSFLLWHLYAERKVIVAGDFMALPSAKQERALKQNAEVMIAVSEQLGFSGLTIPSNYWEMAPGIPARYWLPPEARQQQLKELRKLSTDLFYIVGTGGVLCMPDAENYVEFSYKLFDDPGEIDHLSRKTCDRGMEQVRVWTDLGADGFLTSSDQADNMGPFFNPEQRQRYINPFLKEWVDCVHSHGGYAILHTDGNIMPILNEIIDSGVDALQALDPTAGVDLSEVKSRAGDRLTLCGNVDCGLILTGSPQDVYERSIETIRAGKPGGRFSFGASNVVEPSARRENFDAMNQAWLDAGKYESELKPDIEARDKAHSR